jgi:hypothetical protein
MNILFTHEITKLSGKTSLNDFDKAITKISFRLKGVTSGPIMAETPQDVSMLLPPPTPDNFIPYSDLTEEIISLWIKPTPSYTIFCELITKELEKKINPNQEEIKEFDFDETIFPWMENLL